MLLVVGIIVFGGATRLTNSGLSITEWRPITGILPPLTQAQWMAEFEKYKQIPEFSAEHPDMTLLGFEFIYFMEWGHRMIGRLIGLVYGIPLLFMAFKGRLPHGKSGRFFLIFFLICVQGAVGWWMVHSGLSDDRVDVSQYRLATHLGLAFLILGLLFWTWRDHSEGWAQRRADPVMSGSTTLLAALVYLQIIAGAFVAGTHAGKTYNTWPLMDGDFVPSGYAVMEPFWRNLFENVSAIQFNHRILAYLIVGVAGLVVLKAFKAKAIRGPALLMAGLVAWQVVLGIWALLEAAPLELALAHQFSAILLFLATLWCWRSARRGF